MEQLSRQALVGVSMVQMRAMMQRDGMPAEWLDIGMEMMRQLTSDPIPDPPVSTRAPLASAAASRPPADGLDRISALPDELLRDLVSRLPARDAARTSALSSRWLLVWRSAPLSLVDAHLAGEKSAAVVEAVSRALASHPGPFRCAHLTRTPMEGHRGEVARWIDALAEKGVEEMVFINRPWPLDLPLPAAILRCGASLTRLHLGVWRLPNTRAAPRAASFPRLRELVLSCVAMEERDVAFLLDRSPALEALAVIHCQNGARLRVVSRSLRVLQLCLTALIYLHVVDAPRLERLMIWMTEKGRRRDSALLNIGNAPNLRLLGFMEPGMHDLGIGNTIIKAGMKFSPSTVVRSVKILALEVKFTVRNEARMLPSFLKCFPSVETLHIHSLNADDNEPVGKLNLKFWQDAGLIKCVQHHMKKVIMREFRGTKSELTFLKFIAEHAQKLEMMLVVVANGCFCLRKEDAQAQMEALLASAKWASKGCKLVAFENPCSEVGAPAWSVRLGFCFDISDPFEYINDHSPMVWRPRHGDIVSRLPAKDAARTSALSSRWRLVWRSVPLVLADAHLLPRHGVRVMISPEKSRGLVASVSRALAAHPGPFRCVHLTITAMDAHRSEIARWLDVLAAGVEHLVFLNRPWPLDLPLPTTLLRCGASLTRLHIGFWRFPDTRAAAFPQLRQLSLAMVVIEDRDLAFLLDRSPALETLSVVMGQSGSRVRLASILDQMEL
uniref:F-box domain-containing protein n=1 Tax=Leersia perrieri TaxID=77586 RepID=A0A0D9WQ14_9ORYZ